MTTEPTTTGPAWIAEGAAVAVEEANRQISYETIQRVTATQVTLANGRKFRRASYFYELPTDNGAGIKTNRGGRLVDPQDKHVVDAFAQQQLHRVVLEASATTYGSGATIHTMDAAAVRDELNRIAAVINAARKEIDRRAGL